MDSWVRYSVAVYMGLLLAGAAVFPTEAELERAASAKPQVRHGKIFEPQTGLWFDLIPIDYNTPDWSCEALVVPHPDETQSLDASPFQP